MLISIKDACRLTSLSRSAINIARTQGRFPKAVPLGEKRIAFVRAEVESWVDARIAARPANDNGRAGAEAEQAGVNHDHS